MSEFYVYILASRYRGTIYVGVTNDLSRRMGEHKSGVVPDSPSNTESISLFIASRTLQSTTHVRAAYAQTLAPRLEVQIDRSTESGLAVISRRT